MNNDGKWTHRKFRVNIFITFGDMLFCATTDITILRQKLRWNMFDRRSWPYSVLPMFLLQITKSVDITFLKIVRTKPWKLIKEKPQTSKNEKNHIKSHAPLHNKSPNLSLQKTATTHLFEKCFFAPSVQCLETMPNFFQGYIIIILPPEARFIIYDK